jgi:hypothetical protein
VEGERRKSKYTLRNSLVGEPSAELDAAKVMGGGSEFSAAFGN